MTNICVIFDLDGTLVDSETHCIQAFADLLPGLGDPLEQLVQRYRGKKLATILDDIVLRIGENLPKTFEKVYRTRVSELFAQGLEPMPGVVEMLDASPDARCIASGGPPDKIEQVLQLSGLAPYFGGRIFSSYDIACWKPEPGLFLHAAREMGFAPRRCAVVEDSEVGVKAAIAANMKAFHYSPDGSTGSGAEITIFRDMSLLNDLITTMAV